MSKEIKTFDDGVRWLKPGSPSDYDDNIDARTITNVSGGGVDSGIPALNGDSLTTTDFESSKEVLKGHSSGAAPVARKGVTSEQVRASANRLTAILSLRR